MGIFTEIKEKVTGHKSVPAGSVQVNQDMVKAALSKVVDPDLHRDIVSLGFVTSIKINPPKVAVTVNLTTPACPAKEMLKRQCEQNLLAIEGIDHAEVTMTAKTVGSRSASAGLNKQTQASLGQVKNIIAIASGKGGVGKSTTTVNLAYALMKSGAKVGLMDADVYGPSIPTMTKVKNPTDAVNNMINPPEVDGIKMISMGMFSKSEKASILRGPMAGNVVRQFLSGVDWGELDYLLIDYPPGTGDIQLTISQTAPITGAIIVTTPQEVALIDVRKAISMFETLKVPVLGVIENMSYFVCDNCDKKHYIFRQGGGKRVAGEHGLPRASSVFLKTPRYPLLI